MSDIVLRLKCRLGTFPMTVSLTGSLLDLREQISVLSEIPSASIKLLVGFPPKPLQKFDGSIVDAGLKSGDTIIAEVDTNSASVQQAKIENENNVLKHITEQSIGEGVPLILRKVVPADNSCLFTSMGFVVGGKNKKYHQGIYFYVGLLTFYLMCFKLVIQNLTFE